MLKVIKNYISMRYLFYKKYFKKIKFQKYFYILINKNIIYLVTHRKLNIYILNISFLNNLVTWRYLMKSTTINTVET